MHPTRSYSDPSDSISLPGAAVGFDLGHRFGPARTHGPGGDSPGRVPTTPSGRPRHAGGSDTGRPRLALGRGVRRSWRRRARHGEIRRVEMSVELSTASLRVARQGEGQPLLLLSGLGASLDMWARLAGHLTGFELISFDPPGLGGSGPVRFPVNMTNLAGIAADLLEVLGHDRVDVLGYSWGGALAQELAHRFPDRVRRLVLCASTCGVGGVPGSVAALAVLANPWCHRSRLYLERVAPRLYGGAVGRNPAWFLDASVPPGHPPNPLGYAAQLYAIATWTSLPWLHRLPMPTLIVTGNDDPVVPLANARVLANRIPNCHLHIVEGCGHLLLLDQPGEVAPLVREFLLNPASRAVPRLPWARRQLVVPGR